MPPNILCQFEHTRLKSEEEENKRRAERLLKDEKFQSDLHYNFLDNFPDIGQYIKGQCVVRYEKKGKNSKISER